MGILGSENLDHIPELDYMFKNIWADNADAMSKQYTGVFVKASICDHHFYIRFQERER